MRECVREGEREGERDTLRQRDPQLISESKQKLKLSHWKTSLLCQVAANVTILLIMSN